MSEGEKVTAPPGQRRRASAPLLRFAFETLLAPWPPFGVVLAAVATLGALLPLAEVWALAGLVESLTAGRTGADAPTLRGLFNSFPPYLQWALLFIAIRIGEWLIFMDTFQRYLAARLNERVRERFDDRFYRKALSLRLELFESAAYYETLRRARLALGADAAAEQLTHLQRLVSTAAGCLAILWALGGAHWAIPALLAAGSFYLLRWHSRQEREFVEINYGQTALQRRRDYWRGLLIGRGPAAEARLFGLGDYFMKMWERLTEQALSEVAAARRRNLFRGVPVAAVNLALYGAAAGALILAAGRGRVGAGTLVALLYALQSYLEKMQMIGWRLERAQRFFGELAYVPEFLALEGEEPGGSAGAPARLRRGVRFEGVGFTYPDSARPALAGVNLEMSPGETIALVGENGAGKSTLAKLLLGLYQPTEGVITADGVDLRAIAPAAWREKVGAVMQDYVRYSLTARENIGFGKLERSDDRAAVAAAARMSSAARFIEALPAGYETTLGPEFEGGRDLSAGQWQKLAVARAYLRDPEILVFDEPTSAQDALAEQETYQRFLQLSQGRTVLLISHRLGSARMAGRILFLRRGRIVEQGTHDELMRAGGPYAELYELQARGYRGEEGGGGERAGG